MNTYSGECQEPNRNPDKNQKHEFLGADAFAFASLSVYFARFAVPVLFDRKERKAHAKKRKGRTFKQANRETPVYPERPDAN